MLIYLDTCSVQRPFDDQSPRWGGEAKTGTGNYTEERKELFKDWTLDDVLEETKRRRKDRNA